MNIKLNILFLIISNYIFAQSETDTIIIPNSELPGIYTQEVDTTKHIVDTNKVYEFALVHQKPEFIGGQKEMQKFISQNISQANINKDCKVFVEFIIKRNGEIYKPRILKGCNSKLDRDAVNLVNTFPKWKPGKFYGITANVKYVLPISFEYSP